MLDVSGAGGADRPHAATNAADAAIAQTALRLTVTRAS
jgi:hypothetical protein